MPDSSKKSSKFVQIKGEVERAWTFTVDSLKAMQVVEIEQFKVICENGVTRTESKSTRGVLLKDVLDKAKVKRGAHKERNFYIVARATDNYKATFSWAEIFNSPTGDSTYVVFEENGQPIPNNKGEMAILCKTDIKTAIRHVYMLQSIEVYRVE